MPIPITCASHYVLTSLTGTDEFPLGPAGAKPLPARMSHVSPATIITAHD